MTFQFRAVIGFLRTFVAVLLYGFALVCLLYALMLALVVQDSFNRNSATGDLTGATMGQAIYLYWLAPLAIAAMLLAMLLRWPAQSPRDAGRHAPDRRLMLRMERAGDGTRAIAITILVGAMVAIAWGVGTWSYPGLANAMRDPGDSPASWLLQLLQLSGPLLLLAVACALVALRIARTRGASAREPAEM